MLSADPERAERHDGLLTSGGRSRGGILALCWVTPTPARRQHAAVSHEQSAQIYVYQQNLASRGLSLWWGFISSRSKAELPNRAKKDAPGPLVQAADPAKGFGQAPRNIALACLEGTSIVRQSFQATRGTAGKSASYNG